MKKILLILGVFCLSTVLGCSRQDRDVYHESGNTINVNNKRNELYNEKKDMGVRNMRNDFGYVRHQKSPVMGDRSSNGNEDTLDREKLANMISKYSTDLPNVNDVATLVTDQEVLIAYQTDSKNRKLTADQVKKTGMSAVPRYYHVYVSDDKRLMKEVENLSHLNSTSREARHLIQNVIVEMKSYPQGDRINSNENENGETPDDVKRNMK